MLLLCISSWLNLHIISKIYCCIWGHYTMWLGRWFRSTYSRGLVSAVVEYREINKNLIQSSLTWPALISTSLPIQWVPGLKWPKREAANHMCLVPLVLYAFMPWCLGTVIILPSFHHLFITATEARVRSQASLREICSGQGDLGQVLLGVLGFSSVSIITPTLCSRSSDSVIK
jgi:hypothetical protein